MPSNGIKHGISSSCPHPTQTSSRHRLSRRPMLRQNRPRDEVFLQHGKPSTPHSRGRTQRPASMLRPVRQGRGEVRPHTGSFTPPQIGVTPGPGPLMPSGPGLTGGRQNGPPALTQVAWPLPPQGMQVLLAAHRLDGPRKRSTQVLSGKHGPNGMLPQPGGRLDVVVRE